MAENTRPLLEIKNLKTFFKTRNGTVKAVNDVSYSIMPGKTLGIVGESGSGKSVSAMSVLRLLDANGYIAGGTVTFDGQDLAKISTQEMYHIRGNKISVIFQEPMTSLNPVFSVKRQLSEPFRVHRGMNKKEAAKAALKMLADVKIPNPEVVLKQYPHQLSGGMRQRVMIAMALACEPKLLIADEPTTALDVTIQAQILELMKSLQAELGMAIIMITHDLGVVAQLCDEVIVMYAGSICEQGTADEIFYNPRHEYTKGLLRSIPTAHTAGTRLKPITGTPIDLLNMPAGCPFAPRCDAAMKVCIRQRPERMVINDQHFASCWMNVKEGVEDGSVTLLAEPEKGGDVQ